MDTRGFWWGLLGCVLVAMASPAYSLDEIGAVDHVEALAYGTLPGGERRDLQEENLIYRDEVVETMRPGAVEIRFVDGTRLTLRENSAVVLDDFVFDPNAPDSLLIDLRTGLFQFVSGAVDKEGVKISAIAATIGIRGTNIEIEVAPDGATTLGVREGVAIMTPTAGGAIVEITAGQTGIAQPGSSTISVEDGLPDFMEAALSVPGTREIGADRQHSAARGAEAGDAGGIGGSGGGGSGNGAGGGTGGGTGDGNGSGGAGNGNGQGNGQGDANGNAGNGNSGNGNGQGNGGNGNGNGGGNDR